MTPVYLNPPPLRFPLVELKEEQHLQLFLSPQQAASSLSASTFLNSNTASHQDQTVTKPEESKPHDHKGNQFITHEGSIDQQASSSSSLQSAVDQRTANGHNLSFSTREDGDCESASDNGSSVKWMSSKVRLMKKMMNPNCSGADDKPPKFTHRFQYPVHDSDETNSFSKANNTVRVCSACNTTTTPLWRSGPRGPKSLCNACGIRQRKARRAMEAAAAAAAENGAAAAADASSMKIKVHIHKEKKSRTSHVAQCKKQFKPPYYSPQTQKKLCFEEFAWSLSKNSALQRVFPQDVEDAAILLMELSCGLVHS